MMLCLSWCTNATRQRAAGVVLPKNVRPSSRAVSPCFSSVEAFKGLSRRASVFHRSLKQKVCIVNNMIQPPYPIQIPKIWANLYDDASIPADHCSSITATVGALWLTFSCWKFHQNLRVTFSPSYVRRVWLESCRWPGFQDNAVLGLDWNRRAKHSRRYTCTSSSSQPRDS